MCGTEPLVLNDLCYYYSSYEKNAARIRAPQTSAAKKNCTRAMKPYIISCRWLSPLTVHLYAHYISASTGSGLKQWRSTPTTTPAVRTATCSVHTPLPLHERAGFQWMLPVTAELCAQNCVAEGSFRASEATVQDPTTVRSPRHRGQRSGV